MSHDTDEFPLADDESVPNVLDQRGDRPAQKAHPLPREEDQEEKARLIAQILELQNTLEDLNQRVESVRDESTKLRSENQVLGHYIQNLVASSPIFQPTQAKPSSK
ncbi:short coiled-coil protein isoform 6 [Aphelenchoides avenae]|nr:short coiled-coil protein isoform 6 [Aphelenchus avenae]